MKSLYVLFFFFYNAIASDEWPYEDLMESVPGFSGNLNSRWWSGYVNVSTASKPNNKLSYHYVLVEAENDPENAPLLLWTNGGPGAASLWGLFTEIGPLWLTEDSLKTEEFKRTGIPTLLESSTSWTKFANLLIMNGPPPVSFSYCETGGPGGDGFSCGDWDDLTTAEANFEFLEGWFKKFPVYARRRSEFYLTGESYAGIYIPTLTQQILDHPESTSFSLLTGIAIGDGCIGRNLICSAITQQNNVIEQWFSAQFLYGHGQLPTSVYKEYEERCEVEFLQYEMSFMSKFNDMKNLKTEFIGSRQRELSSFGEPSAECVDLYWNIRDIVNFFNVYGLYDECWDIPNVPFIDLINLPKYQPYPCGGNLALSIYLAQDSVKEQFHVPQEAVFFSADNGKGMNYEAVVKNLIPWHYSIATDTNLRVLIYNGDTDHDLNSFFSEWWINALELSLLEDWRAWTLDSNKEVVGYTMSFIGDYSYVTIRGSGHMVPTMKPRQSFEMMKSWISRTPLKTAAPIFN